LYSAVTLMPAHILQVAYYPTLQETRTELLKTAGYRVTSVLGNDEAMGLNGAVIAAADLVVVGFSAAHSVRAAMVHWFKAHHPSLPVIVLQFYRWEKFPEADVATLSEDPATWLAEVANTLRS
jgi:DNA-binding NtrC family response regulator